MTEERERILTMLKEGKITVEEAESLLDAMSDGTEVVEEPKGQARFLRIKITDLDEGKVTTNINVPIGLANTLARFIPKKYIGDTDIDFQEILSILKQGGQGKIIDVVDEDEDERVEIIID